MSILNSNVPRTIQRLYKDYKAKPETIDEFIAYTSPAIEEWTDEQIDAEFEDFLTK